MVAMINTAAIDCNNLGADFLQAGHPEEALEAFQEATKLRILIMPISGVICLEATRKESPPAVSASVSEALGVVVFKVKERMQRWNLLRVLPATKICFAREKLHYDRSSMMFTAPMKISNLNCGPESNTTILAATLLYNVALTFHLYGTDEKSMRTSARLFERAYTCLAYLEEDGSKRYLEQLRMASLNNSGHMHHKLGNYEAAKQHLAGLYHFVLSLPASLSSEDLSERQAVLFNALMLLREPSIAAAA